MTSFLPVFPFFSIAKLNIYILWLISPSPITLPSLFIYCRDPQALRCQCTAVRTRPAVRVPGAAHRVSCRQDHTSQQTTLAKQVRQWHWPNVEHVHRNTSYVFRLRLLLLLLLLLESLQSIHYGSQCNNRCRSRCHNVEEEKKMLADKMLLRFSMSISSLCNPHIYMRTYIVLCAWNYVWGCCT